MRRRLSCQAVGIGKIFQGRTANPLKQPPRLKFSPSLRDPFIFEFKVLCHSAGDALSCRRYPHRLPLMFPAERRQGGDKVRFCDEVAVDIIPLRKQATRSARLRIETRRRRRATASVPCFDGAWLALVQFRRCYSRQTREFGLLSDCSISPCASTE